MKNIIIIGISVVAIMVASYLILENDNKKINNNQNNNNEMNQENTSNENQEKADLEILAEILKEGSGQAAKTGDKLTVHYVGTFENGTKFDSSVDKGIPFEFVLGVGRVIQGWDFGVVGMKVGEKRKLIIPYQLAYGEEGQGPIPPKANLIFEIELLGISQQ